ncbi:hypothetical protein [Clostridium sp.]|uniref:hypothetical protein n=1 Tax=Clostridium sp. TaxID=1506 RepID=UPI002911C330|nr:hypothetical protein [Clostridium sp.]MDU7005648.1 hypothetical protein [Clostridium sp.]MDU7068017.1 hypothetical protein [Clostridium perfringens]
MLAFKLRNSVKVFEDNQEITLSVGVLENNIITLSKNELSNEFEGYIRELLKNKIIEIDEEEEIYNELLKIYNLGFLSFQYKKSDKKILILNVDERFEYKLENKEGVDLVNYSDMFSEEESDILISKTDTIEFQKVYFEAERKLKEYECVMIVGGMCYLNKLLMLNYIITKTYIPSIFFTYDLYSCYVLGVNSKIGTGCFECFTNNLLSKKNILDSKYQSNNQEMDLGVECFLNGVINTEIKNIKVFKESIIYGNVITYIPGLYQYTFDFSRRTVQCDNCINDFYNSFEEQNIASMNVIKEIVG